MRIWITMVALTMGMAGWLGFEGRSGRAGRGTEGVRNGGQVKAMDDPNPIPSPRPR